MAATRVLFVILSLIPALIAGQKYMRGSSMGSFYPNDLTDDEPSNGGGGRFFRGYDNKNDDRDEDDSNEAAGPWQGQGRQGRLDRGVQGQVGRYARLNSDLQMLRDMTRLEKRLLAGIALKRRNNQAAFVPRWETDEDEMDNVFRISPKSSAGEHLRYWDKSCNCWKFVQSHVMRRRGFSISAPMALVSHYIDAAKDQDEMDANRKYLLQLGRK